MLVVKIELHSAVTGKVSTIGKMIIGNMGTGTEARGDYRVAVGKKPTARDKLGGLRWQGLDQIWLHPLREGEVKDYPRLSYNVWRLVIRALLSAFPEEKNR